MVLLRSPMRNRANHLLAALAAADMVVFISLLPYCLASYPIFYNSNTFRSLLGTIKIYIAAFANWFSCAAIWFVLTISIEKFLIIKFPFRSLQVYKVKSTLLAIIINLTLTFLLTHHHFVSRKCALMEMCKNGSEYTEIYVLCLSRSFENWSLYDPSWTKPPNYFDIYVDFGTICNAIFGVICPVFIVAVLNILLINLLHKSKCEIAVLTANKQYAEIQERKMAKTIVTLITCFTITNIPSAFVFLYETFFLDETTLRTSTIAFANVASLTNFLVITGKSMNIFLLCLSSEVFRHNCKEKIRSLIAFGSSSGRDERNASRRRYPSVSTKTICQSVEQTPKQRRSRKTSAPTESIPMLIMEKNNQH